MSHGHTFTRRKHRRAMMRALHRGGIALKLMVLVRSRGECAYCRQALTTQDMTMDHIVPLKRGGSRELDNLVAACVECNHQKGHQLWS